MTLPLKLESEKDLDLVLAYYFSIPKDSNSKHLRFGQYIFNNYSIESGNSYNTPDIHKAYNLILDYITEGQ